MPWNYILPYNGGNIQPCWVGNEPSEVCLSEGQHLGPYLPVGSSDPRQEVDGGLIYHQTLKWQSSASLLMATSHSSHQLWPIAPTDAQGACVSV